MKAINLKDEEIKALVDLMDAGLKTLGISHAIPAAVLIQKIQGAEEAAETPPLKSVKESKE